jgi:alkylation response protein AidB-like acyl-CoA dehydrogenase
MVVEEIAAGCAGLAACIVGVMHAITPILIAGTEKQKRTYLSPLTKGQPVLASFALTEPYGGSDLTSLKTSAKKLDKDYVLNGTKDYIVNGAVAELVTACAQVRPEYGRGGLQFFLVPGKDIKVSRVRNKMGIRYANTAQIIFDNTLVKEENVLGQDGSGYLLLTQTLDYGRALVGAVEVGIARAAYDLALKYAREREQFGRPIFANQGISFPLVEMATIIDAARLLVWRACWLMDQNDDYSKESSMAKVFASEMAQKVTSKAIDIMGATGYSSDGLLSMYYRDAKVGSIVEGTNNIQKMTIASLL